MSEEFMRPNTFTMDKFPIPVWEWSRVMQWVNYKWPHRVEDFAKSYSRNQFYAKTWLVECLDMIDYDINHKTNIWLLGGWYGTLLVPLLQQKYKIGRKIHLVDFDKEALEIAHYLHGHHIQTHHLDCNFEWERIEKCKADILINTSCEHMYPMTDLKTDALCVFQSTNFKDDHAHINPVDTLGDFINQCNFKETLFSGDKMFHDYDDEHKRFMVIGYK